MAASRPLNPKQLKFVERYLATGNATQSYIDAGYKSKGKNAGNIASIMLENVGIKAAIDAARDAAKRNHVATAAAVLDRFWAIATADPNELIEYRRTCCRYCYGTAFRYQRTAGELDRDRAARAADPKNRKAKFDVLGGAGYDARRDPNPLCPECFGEGVGTAFAKDTRSLSPAARALYAGVKQTKEGLEVKTHDQQAALVNVAKLLGMYTERHEHTGSHAQDGSNVEGLAKILAAIGSRLPPGGGTGGATGGAPGGGPVDAVGAELRPPEPGVPQ